MDTLYYVCDLLLIFGVGGIFFILTGRHASLWNPATNRFVNAIYWITVFCWEVNGLFTIGPILASVSPSILAPLLWIGAGVTPILIAWVKLVKPTKEVWRNK